MLHPKTDEPISVFYLSFAVQQLNGTKNSKNPDTPDVMFHNKGEAGNDVHRPTLVVNLPVTVKQRYLTLKSLIFLHRKITVLFYF